MPEYYKLIPVVRDRLEAGQSVEQIASDLGLPLWLVSKVASEGGKEEKTLERRG